LCCDRDPVANLWGGDLCFCGDNPCSAELRELAVAVEPLHTAQDDSRGTPTQGEVRGTERVEEFDFVRDGDSPAERLGATQGDVHIGVAGDAAPDICKPSGQRGNTRDDELGEVQGDTEDDTQGDLERDVWEVAEGVVQRGIALEDV